MGDQREGQRFDAEHGVITQAMLFLGDLDGDRIGDAILHATHYEGVPIADFETLLALVPDEVVRRSTFVDIGSGMGRAMMLAMRAPFAKIVGVEVSAALHETAKENIENAFGLDVACRDIRLVCADARRFAYPPGDLVLFLYNPFDAEALRETLLRVAERKDPGSTWLLYHTPEHVAVAEALGYRRLGVPENVPVALAVHVEQDADDHEVGEHGATAVGHER